MDLNFVIFPAPKYDEWQAFGLEKNIVWIPVKDQARSQGKQKEMKEFMSGVKEEKSVKIRESRDPREKRDRRVRNSFDEVCEVKPGEEFDAGRRKPEINEFPISGSCLLQKCKPDLSPVKVKKTLFEEDEYSNYASINNVDLKNWPTQYKNEKTEKKTSQITRGFSFFAKKANENENPKKFKYERIKTSPIKPHSPIYEDPLSKRAKPEFAQSHPFSGSYTERSQGISEAVQKSKTNSFTPTLPKRPISKSKIRSVSGLKDRQVPESTHSVPCLLLKPYDRASDSVLIMLHANAEDIFQAYDVARLMQAFLRVLFAFKPG